MIYIIRKADADSNVQDITCDVQGCGREISDRETCVVCGLYSQHCPEQSHGEFAMVLLTNHMLVKHTDLISDTALKECIRLNSEFVADVKLSYASEPGEYQKLYDRLISILGEAK